MRFKTSFDFGLWHSLSRLSTAVWRITSVMTLHGYQPTAMLRSSTAHLLQPPLVLTSVASHAFTVTEPAVWNTLSANTRSAEFADSFASFKRGLKSELFGVCIYLGRFSAMTNSDLSLTRNIVQYKSNVVV